MKKFLSILAIAAMATSFWACGEDEETTPSTDAPDVNAPTSVTDVVTEGAVEITFEVETEAGYSSASVTAVGGTAVITSEPAVGAVSGDVVVTFTAGTTEGDGSVTLTVTDADSETESATAIIEVTNTITVTDNITTEVTWEEGKIYLLEGRIAVESGGILNIEPGVIVKGAAGGGSNASVLIVARGGKIYAEGTATQPIIFTSESDDIEPGEIESPNLTPLVNGLWGGLIVLGNAPISAPSDNQTAQIEGIPADDANGTFGGTNAADNSGIIRYVSIRHGGTNLGEGNEINGLTLGGVGSGTTIEYVEVIGNADDGIEWFGGTVNVKHALVWYASDDAIDTDYAWAGTLDNFIVISPRDKCFELDGGEGTLDNTHTITNGSIKVSDAVDERNSGGLVDFDSDSFTALSNLYFFGFSTTATPYPVAENPVTAGTYVSIEATIPAGRLESDFFAATAATFVTEVADGENTVGADITQFADWSWASESGALDDF